MPQHNEAVIIDGSNDEIQLQVQGDAQQTEPLQTWETSAADPLAQVTHDGRFQIGSFESGMMATDDALIEAHRHENDTTKPKRGLHLLGEVTGVLDSLVSWVVQELVLKGSAAISGLHTTLRVRLHHVSSGDSTAAELLAADIEAGNATGTSTTRLGQLTGLRTAIVNGESGYVDQAVALDVRVNSSNPDTEDAPINTAYGIRVGNVDQGADNYALHTGTGLVHLGDTLELQQQATDPATPPADVVRIYPKSDGKLYAKNDTGMEYDLTGGGSSGGTLEYIRVWEQKNPNADGGTFNSGAWRTRILTDMAHYTGSSMTTPSPNNNQFKLQPGTYDCFIRAPAHKVDWHQARLYNVTNAETTLVGSTTGASSNYNGGGDALIVGRFTITTATDFEIQHRCDASRANNGFGGGVNYGELNFFTVAEFWKVI